MSLRIETNRKLDGYIESLIGGRKENQDAAGFLDVPLGSIVVVCDGMGGGKGGSTASHLAVQTVIDDVSKAEENNNPREVLTSAIIHANEVIITRGKADSTLEGMGTTLVAAIISEQSAVVAHVGDSRFYQLRGHEKVFRTWDHSMVFQMVESGLISEEDARNHPQSNIILAGLGISETVAPTISEISYNKGDRFLLCTDGFWGAMPEKELLKKITSRGNLQETLENTAKEVNSIGIRSGGLHDNLTAAAIIVQCNSKLKPKMRKNQIIVLSVLICTLIVSIALNVLSFRRFAQAGNGFSFNELFGTKEVVVGDSIPFDTISVNSDTIKIKTQ